MYEAEQKINENSDWSLFCLAESDTNTSCSTSAYLSFTRNFASIDTLTQAEIDTVLTAMSLNSTFFDANKIFFEESFSQTNLKSSLARSIFVPALPLEIDGVRYDTEEDRQSTQLGKYYEFSHSVRNDVLSVTSDMLKINFYGLGWDSYFQNLELMKDMQMLIYSLLFLTIYMSFHFESFFLGLMAVIEIALTIPLTIFVNRFIFQITFFGVFNSVGIFVILGIAVDDMFVLTDMWAHSATIPELNKGTDHEILHKRMSFTWRKTSKAIFTTSITDCISFLATGFSKIMPISSFGYFTSSAVMIDYTLTVTMFPCFIIIHEKYFASIFTYRELFAKLKSVFKRDAKVDVAPPRVQDEENKNGESVQDTHIRHLPLE